MDPIHALALGYQTEDRKLKVRISALTSSRSGFLAIGLVRNKIGIPILVVNCCIKERWGLECSLPRHLLDRICESCQRLVDGPGGGLRSPTYVEKMAHVDWMTRSHRSAPKDNKMVGGLTPNTTDQAANPPSG